MYTYQVWYGTCFIAQFTEPEYADAVINYADHDLSLRIEIDKRNPLEALFDTKPLTVDCFYLILAKTGIRI